MNAAFDAAAVNLSARDRYRLGLATLCHVVTSCVSLIFITEYYRHLLPLAENSRDRILAAAIGVVPFALCSIVFTMRRFSFGYALGFYFFTLILGYIWLVEFSTFPYDHRAAAISAFASGIAFLIPTLLVGSPFPRRFTLTAGQLRGLLAVIVPLSIVVLAIGTMFEFQLASPEDMYKFRSEISLPRWLQYAIGIVSGALLPFAYACFVQFKRYALAALCLLLLVLFYPVTLTKVSLLAPGWMLFLTVLCAYFETRMAVVLSLLLPILAGVLMVVLYRYGLRGHNAFLYFGTVNFRMIAMPSSALDFYNDFFTTHQLTHFCQITPLKLIMACPYDKPLSLYMADSYHLGYFNASLFATEGIASVGMALAPASALVCGLIISLGNRAAAGLPPRFVLLSSGLLLQIFINVPLTIALVTHGAAVLFLLWYVAPRDVLGDRPAEVP
ncbi:hypothetical protein GWG65_19905 [Bradyrhizobium sp. CSA207]|uniref:hypothetical protein n=1 Tax=Bradyrhizobium sp. CSA207 TaxID=2698826 RepID=UPI0023B0006E|nr:hypothetical protein [Bradyrhizobium sp. CSA207]MDE5443668.1 hypothetical protein [Bradyrhizobium sp. CSA207]